MTVAETKAQEDRRKRHEARQVAAGYTRAIVRCHKDDVAKIKAFAAGLLAERKNTSPAEALPQSD